MDIFLVIGYLCIYNINIHSQKQFVLQKYQQTIGTTTEEITVVIMVINVGKNINKSYLTIFLNAAFCQI